MAEIFMTFIGTNKYEPVNYTLNGDCENNRFVSKALLQMLTRQGKKFDRLYFFLTESAEKLNWRKYVRYKYQSTEILEEDTGLEGYLSEHFPGQFEPVSIPDGNNEAEIAELFRKIYDKLLEGDNVTVDTTHGYRSLPLLFSPVLQYAKELKGITVAHMYYGLYTDKNHDAPILDMRTYDRILDCSNAAHNFLQSGNAAEIKDVFMNYYSSLPMEEKKQHGTPKTNVRLLEDLTLALLTCQGGEQKYSILPQIGQIVSRFQSQSDTTNADHASAAPRLVAFMDELLRHTMGSFRDFGDCQNKIEQFFYVIRWYLEHDLLPQGYTALRETIITMLCLLYAPEFSDGEGYLQEDLRESLKNVLEECVPHASQKASLENSMRYLVKLLHDRPKYAPYKLPLIKLVYHMEYDRKHDGRNLQDFMNRMGKSRNCIDHFGMKLSKDSRKIQKADLQKDYDDAMTFYHDLESRRANILTDEQAQAKLDEFLAAQTGSGAFVNFSNHPSDRWNEDQITAALAFPNVQQIEDVPFPQVAACASEAEIKALAEESVRTIKALHPAAVMCMGEMGVCWQVVNLLKEAGIRVVYTCTERQASETVTADSTEKTSVFRFVKFREY